MYTAFRGLVILPSSSDWLSLYCQILLLVYFYVSGEGWDQTRDLLSTRLVNRTLHNQTMDVLTQYQWVCTELTIVVHV